jgi:hypothetical protein
MQNTTKPHTEQKTFKQWYADLPASQQEEKRNLVMQKLNIKRSMFYTIVRRGKNFKPAEIEAINKIAGEELSFEAEDLTATLNLTK